LRLTKPCRKASTASLPLDVPESIARSQKSEKGDALYFLLGEQGWVSRVAKIRGKISRSLVGDGQLRAPPAQTGHHSGYNPCMIVDNALYVDGKRADEPRSLREAHEACRARQALAWIGLDRPTEGEFAAVAEEFGLHELAVEDSVKAHQRPKLERYDGTLFVVLKPARYLEETNEVEFSEAHVFVGENFVVTVRHGEVPAFSAVRECL
jgi:Mg2+ and Co2+ transporter CorA